MIKIIFLSCANTYGLVQTQAPTLKPIENKPIYFYKQLNVTVIMRKFPKNGGRPTPLLQV